MQRHSENLTVSASPTPLVDSEPCYIAQTFEPEHLHDPVTARAWFQKQGKLAHDEGCTWPRMTVNEDQTGLLFEAWKDRPSDEGEPRWSKSVER